jgi:uncharacterized protein (DUF302 family)
MNTQLGFEVMLNMPYMEALDHVAAALKTEGFGVLTRIDVRETLKEKLGVEFRPYTILGACNPPLAHRALSALPEIGLMLPCNVTVEDAGDQKTLVRILNPDAMLLVDALSQNEAVQAVAQDARARLERVAQTLRS